MLPFQVSPTCEDFDPEVWGILGHKEQTVEFASTPPRGILRPIAIRPLSQNSWDCASPSEVEGERRTPQSVMKEEALGRVERWVMTGGGQWSYDGEKDGRRPQTFDDFDLEVWGIFGHEEQTAEFISTPPRGILRPIAIRPVPKSSWNCAEKCPNEFEGQKRTSKSDEDDKDLNRVERLMMAGDGQWSCYEGEDDGRRSVERSEVTNITQFDQLDLSDKELISVSAEKVEKKPKIRSLFDRLRKFVHRILG